MKKLFILLIAFVLSFGLIACQTNGTTTDVQTTDGSTTNVTTTEVVTEPANEFPTLSGIQNEVTVQVGQVFDPLAGVTANDAEDGVIPSENIVVEGLEGLYLDSEGKIGAEAGGASVTLLYKVEDSNGAKAQKYSTVTVEVVVDPTENLIVNGDFVLGANGWTNPDDGSLLDLHNGGAGTAEVLSEALVVTITNGSWDGGSSPRVNQEGLNFVNGQTYEVSFDAKADVAGFVLKSQVGVLLSGDPWFTAYYYNPDGGAYEFTLGTEYQTFSYKFTVTEATTDNGTLTIELGAHGDDTPYVVSLDNVVVKETTPDPDTAAPVFSGLTDTSVGLSETFDALDGVSFYDVDTELTNADIVVTHDGGTGVTEDAGVYSFSELGDVVFTYTLEDASGNIATETRTISVVAMVYDQPYALQGSFTAQADEDSVVINYVDTPAQFWANIAILDIVNFDGTQTSISFTFTGVDTHDYLFKIEFADGTTAIEYHMIADGTEQVATVDLSGLTEANRDSIKLFAFFVTTEGASGSVDIANVTYNQKDYVEEWTGYGMSTEAFYGGVEVVTYDVIGDPWWNPNAQLPVSGFDGTNDSIIFTFMGVLDQSYMIKVETATDATPIETPFVGTGAMQDVVVDLSSWTEADRDGMDLYILFVNEVGAPAGEISVYGWEYAPAFIPTWSVYGNLGVVADEDSEMISYPGLGFDWGNNAQLAVTIDGTNTSIDLTVIGEVGHTYKFKVEEANVAGWEIDFTGTGAEQVVTLDLSTLTEAQRSAINKFVLFVLTPDQAGTLDVIGWDYTPVE